MVDVSFGVPRLPAPGVSPGYAGANAIEYNLLALIRAWPAFEDLTVLDKVGSYGYLDTRNGETASPSDGLRVELIQHLPRLIVLLSGEGLEHVAWTGMGWTEEAPGQLVYQLKELTGANATAALGVLVISAAGDASVTVTLAAENLMWEPDGLRLAGEGRTKLLFRGHATWGLVKVKRLTWGGAKPLAWNEAKSLRKD